jgi:hypothetical protein
VQRAACRPDVGGVRPSGEETVPGDVVVETSAEDRSGEIRSVRRWGIFDSLVGLVGSSV